MSTKTAVRDYSVELSGSDSCRLKTYLQSQRIQFEKKPFIQHVREEEWPMVQQSLAAICEDHGISISKVLWKIKHDDPKKYIDKETEDDENTYNNEKEED